MNIRTFIAILIMLMATVAVVLMSLLFLSMIAMEKVVRFFFGMMFRVCGISLSCYGEENIFPGRSYIFISNHSSILDIPSVKLSMPLNVKFIAKKELFRVPLFGYGMRRMGQIPIDRANRRRAIKSLSEAKRRLKEGFSIWMAPEGTRNADGTIGSFKKGAFLTASQAGVEIVPVSICGTWKILPRKTWKIRPGKIDVYVHNPIRVNKEDILSTVNEAHRIISEDIHNWKSSPESQRESFMKNSSRKSMKTNQRKTVLSSSFESHLRERDA